MTKDKKQELKIEAIENGTVIDHITANKSLHILKILGLPDNETQNITIAMNVSSSEIGRKDILKIENRELNHEELNQIALIAPKATVNIIRNFEPVKKDKIIPLAIFLFLNLLIVEKFFASLMVGSACFFISIG